MAISESCSWHRLAAFSLALYTAAYPVALHLLLTFGKRPPPARLFAGGTTPCSVLTLYSLGNHDRPPRLPWSTFHACRRLLHRRSGDCSFPFSSSPASDFPYRTKGRQPENPRLCQQFPSGYLYDACNVRYPTACMSVSPLWLALSIPRPGLPLPAPGQLRFPVWRLCHCASESLPCHWFRGSGSQTACLKWVIGTAGTFHPASWPGLIRAHVRLEWTWTPSAY